MRTVWWTVWAVNLLWINKWFAEMTRQCAEFRAEAVHEASACLVVGAERGTIMTPIFLYTQEELVSMLLCIHIFKNAKI